MTLQEKQVPVPIQNLPLLAGFAFQMITQAVHEAQRARNRDTAACAIRWLRARTDWTRIPIERRIAAWGSPAPPREAILELPLTFEWCCSVLGVNPEDTRRHGPPYRENNRRFYLWRGGLANWREWRENRGQKHPPSVPEMRPSDPEPVGIALHG